MGLLIFIVIDVALGFLTCLFASLITKKPFWLYATAIAPSALSGWIMVGFGAAFMRDETMTMVDSIAPALLLAPLHFPFCAFGIWLAVRSLFANLKA